MTTAIVGATLIDPVRDEPLGDAIVVVDEDGRIAHVGPASRSAIPRGAHVIDAAGFSLLPGLIDCHLHLAFREEWLVGHVGDVTFTDVVAHALAAGRDLVEHGVTTVRDAGGATAGIRRAFASGAFPGPRLQVSTGMLGVRGTDDIGRTPMGLLFGSCSELPWGPADGVASMRREARLRIAAGADWIKVRNGAWVGRPDLDPERSQFTVEELRAAVDEAAAAGIHGVMCHTLGPRSIRTAISAGIRSIEHGNLIDDEGIEMALRMGAVIVAGQTIEAPPGSAARRIQDGHPDRDPHSETNRHYWELVSAKLRAAADRGVRFALGSDQMGDVLPHAVLAEYAPVVGAHGVLRMATIEGARLLGLEDEVGTVEPGKRADLMLFRGDPLADPELWRDPERVVLSMAQGRVMADRRDQGSSGIDAILP